MSYENEKQVAIKAEQILQSALRSRISSLGFRNYSSGDNKSISDASAVSSYKLGKATEDQLRYYMNKLSIKMERHGFIHHYGDKGTRSATTRTRHKPRTTSYQVRAHSWDLPARDYIDDAIRQSGVVDFVLVNITELRAQQIIVSLKNFLEK